MPAKNPPDSILHQPKLNNPSIFSKKERESGQESNERIHVHYGGRDPSSCTTAPMTKNQGTMEGENSSNSGRERLKRCRVEVAGRVGVPELWGQEDFLKDWTDCAVFDAAVMTSSVVSAARASMVEQGRTTDANPSRLGIKNI